MSNLVEKTYIDMVMYGPCACARRLEIMDTPGEFEKMCASALACFGETEKVKRLTAKADGLHDPANPNTLVRFHRTRNHKHLEFVGTWAREAQLDIMQALQNELAGQCSYNTKTLLVTVAEYQDG
jgi:hypothetical protein